MQGNGVWTNSDKSSETTNASEDRKWTNPTQNLGLGGLSSLLCEKENGQKGASVLTPTLLQLASKNIGKNTTCIVVHVLKMCLEECPEQILSLSFSSVIQMQSGLFDRSDDTDENNINNNNNNNSKYKNDKLKAESNNTIASNDFLSFMQMILSILLHGISSNQSVDSYCQLFECACTVIRKFGFRLFLAAASDSLQVIIRKKHFYFCLPFYFLFLSFLSSFLSRICFCL